MKELVIALSDPGSATNCSRVFFEHLYDALHARARQLVKAKHRLDPIGPTSLVHDAFLRLRRSETLDANDENHFIALASGTMRRIIVDRARRIRAEKHGGGVDLAPISENEISLARDPVELIAIDQVLDSIAIEHPRAAQVGELLIYGTLRPSEIAAILDVSTKTVQRDMAELEEHLRAAGYGRKRNSSSA
jgi:RNA polymerase sigma factor (TIGR02999 family)